MNTNNETQQITINGAKFDVDMRHATRIDTLTIGSKVKLLKRPSPYESGIKVFPGVVVGFEPFPSLPTIIVAYLDVDYSSAKLLFQPINSETRDKFEMVASVDDDLPIAKNDVLARMDREAEVKRAEIEELERKRDYFLQHFGRYFEAPRAAA